MDDISDTHVFLTGATGFVGSHLLKVLIENEYAVTCLIRGGEKSDPHARLKRTLSAISETGLSNKMFASRIRVLEGDITHHRLGLTSDVYARLAREVKLVFHCAAATSFLNAHAEAVRYNNEIGTQNILQFVRDAKGITGFHYISTAYVAGNRRGVIREDDLNHPREFNNAYEQSKFSAEKMVREFQLQQRVPCSIYRPSIIVGDYHSGHTINFNTIYLFLKLVHFLKSKHNKTTKDGKIFIPLRIVGNPDATKNFVPIDYVIHMIMAVVEKPDAQSTCYHLVNHNPPTINDIKDAILDLLEISGPEFVKKDDFDHSPPSEMEKIFLSETQIYAPYLMDEPCFDNANIKQLFSNPEDGLCPPMDRDALKRLFKFAIASDWGGKLWKANSSPEKKTAVQGTPHLIHQYFKAFLPSVMGQSIFADLVNLNAIIQFSFTDSQEKWSITIDQGKLAKITPDFENHADVTYEVDDKTFHEVVSGALSPQQSFFTNRARIIGDTLKGLKLASILERFIKQYPFTDGSVATGSADR